jgi:hypothetical protein
MGDGGAIMGQKNSTFRRGSFKNVWIGCGAQPNVLNTVDVQVLPPAL